MTPAKLSQVEQMRASGNSLTEIADALSVARATITYMSDQPFVPLSRRFSGQDVEDAVPYEGVPDHLKYPLRDWLSNVLASDQGRSSLNRRVAVLLRLRVLTSLEGAANYAAMIFQG